MTTPSTALTPGDAHHALPEMVLRPARGWMAVDWRELWEYRELLGFLVLRDVKVRYKQTVLGVSWAVLQPVFTMVVFSVIFGGLAKLPSDGLPYPVFVYAGLLAWQFFSSSVTSASNSLLNQQALLTKIYLPRLYVPISTVLGSLVDLLISFAVFAVIMAIYRVMPGWGLLALPILVVVTTMAALGVGLVLAALVVTYRDIRHIVPFLLQAWLYVSPVIYPVTMIPEQWRWLLALNPIAGIIDGYRSALLQKPWDVQTLAVSTVASVAVFLFGVFYFRKTERRFADIA